MFGSLTLGEVLVLAVVLAPTDAALGQAVVSDPRLPSRIRQGLNVESGLNDGICVPLLLIFLAAADVESNTESSHTPFGSLPNRSAAASSVAPSPGRSPPASLLSSAGET